MTKAKSKKKEELEPLPVPFNRPSVAPAPPSSKSRWGEFRISPELAKYDSMQKKRST